MLSTRLALITLFFNMGTKFIRRRSKQHNKNPLPEKREILKKGYSSIANPSHTKFRLAARKSRFIKQNENTGLFTLLLLINSNMKFEFQINLLKLRYIVTACRIYLGTFILQHMGQIIMADMMYLYN